MVGCAGGRVLLKERKIGEARYHATLPRLQANANAQDGSNGSNILDLDTPRHKKKSCLIPSIDVNSSDVVLGYGQPEAVCRQSCILAELGSDEVTQGAVDGLNDDNRGFRWRGEMHKHRRSAYEEDGSSEARRWKKDCIHRHP